MVALSAFYHNSNFTSLQDPKWDVGNILTMRKVFDKRVVTCEVEIGWDGLDGEGKEEKMDGGWVAVGLQNFLLMVSCKNLNTNSL